MTEGEYSLRFAEYTVAKRPTGKNRLARILLLLAYFLFALAYVIAFTVIWLLPQVIAVLPLLLVIFIFFTRRLVKYDICVRLDSGRFTVTQISGKLRRVRLDRRIQDVTSGGAFETLPPGTEFLDLRGDPNAKNGWYLTFGDVTAVFQATKQLTSAIRYYVPEAGRNDGQLPF